MAPRNSGLHTRVPNSNLDGRFAAFQNSLDDFKAMLGRVSGEYHAACAPLGVRRDCEGGGCAGKGPVGRCLDFLKPHILTK